MNTGSYARVYLFTLENGLQAVGRVIFCIRETVKTEAEIAVMELVRCTQSTTDTVLRNPLRCAPTLPTWIESCLR